MLFSRHIYCSKLPKLSYYTLRVREKIWPEKVAIPVILYLPYLLLLTAVLKTVGAWGVMYVAYEPFLRAVLFWDLPFYAPNFLFSINLRFRCWIYVKFCGECFTKNCWWAFSTSYFLLLFCLRHIYAWKICLSGVSFHSFVKRRYINRNVLYSLVSQSLNQPLVSYAKGGKEYLWTPLDAN